MPRKSKPPALVGGPYHPPMGGLGNEIWCVIHGLRTVEGLSETPIPWPYWSRCGNRIPIVCGDLIRAVRTESVAAICHHWGVGRSVVARWRRALGVGRMNPGTRARWVELTGRKFTHARRVAGGKTTAARKREGARCESEK